MIKVVDKVRVTTEDYLNNFPRGAICTVVRDRGGGCISAAIDGGDGFWWFFEPDDYEPFTEEEPEQNYAAQAAKHGIKITVQFKNGNVVIFDGTK